MNGNKDDKPYRSTLAASGCYVPRSERETTMKIKTKVKSGAGSLGQKEWQD
jgi:hypothetical protein